MADDDVAGYAFHLVPDDDGGLGANDDDEDDDDLTDILNQAGAITQQAIAEGKLEPTKPAMPAKPQADHPSGTTDVDDDDDDDGVTAMLRQASAIKLTGGIDDHLATQGGAKGTKSTAQSTDQPKDDIGDDDDDDVAKILRQAADMAKLAAHKPPIAKPQAVKQATEPVNVRPTKPTARKNDGNIHTISRSNDHGVHSKVAFMTAARQLTSLQAQSVQDAVRNVDTWTIEKAVAQLTKLEKVTTLGSVTPLDARVGPGGGTLAPGIENLAKPKPKGKTKQTFATLSDAKECRFYTRKTKASEAAMRNPACGYDFVSRQDGDETNQNEDFIARMEAAENNRRKRLETTRGEEAYNVRQNKKQCPKCGMVQSYAEYRDKKKKCTFCGVPFALPKAWGDVGVDFFDRMEEWATLHEANQLKIRHAVTLVERQRAPKTARQKLLENRLEKKAADPLSFIYDYLRNKRKLKRSGPPKMIHMPLSIREKLMERLQQAAAQERNEGE
ncbi:Aste57867_15085 [Aphanomyces stellatus]|uniref:Aste57867_15085 protein n=1 Tax=Aphanomyces stellatus TaxID=120398 RepID=A0A485L451_9STRA|nr:hypothetical protein As57867_015029 [Aphanomyces stellatus]VFT91898.1 Aste57867_15085 [Aphanomyces stellatus]